jgi:hypothetical protein
MSLFDAIQLLKRKNIVDFVERGQRSQYYINWTDGGVGTMSKKEFINYAKLFT